MIVLGMALLRALWCFVSGRRVHPCHRLCPSDEIVRHRVCDAVLDASKLLVMSLQVNSRPLFLLVDGWPIHVSPW